MPDIAPIKRAATVVLLRDSPRGPEVFMVRRTLTIAFMAGAHVFPGGRVDDADAVDASWCDLPNPDALTRYPDLGFAVTAARELFEEAGILLARYASGQLVSLEDVEVGPRVSVMRGAIHDKKLLFNAALAADGLRLAVDLIVPFARWVTPPNEVRRFDTWFFVARMPVGQAALHDDRESMASTWLTPAAAIAACIAGDINLPPPTWATLRELESFPTVADVEAWAATRSIVQRSPLLYEDAAGKEIIMPGNARHPSKEAVTFETRFVWTGQRWLPDLGVSSPA